MTFFKASIISVLLFFANEGLAQKYNFTFYTVDDGLPQSQVYNLLQDGERHIWLASGGGISRFDGKSFRNYSKREGLSSNSILQFTIDSAQRIWLIARTHLNLITNSNVQTFELPEPVSRRHVRIGVDALGALWCLINGKLYVFSKGKFLLPGTMPFANSELSFLFTDNANNLYVVANQKEIFRYSKGEWTKFAGIRIGADSRIIQLHVDGANNLWILTERELLLQKSGSDDPAPWFTSTINGVMGFRCLSIDHKSNVWIGTNAGAFKIKPDKTYQFFNYKNGFTDFWVNSIFPDAEGNVWLSTEGSGLVKYAGSTFTSFDNTAGYFPSGVFAVSKYPGNKVVLGLGANDLCIYDGRGFTYPLRNTALRSTQFIYSAYADSLGTLWIGTVGNGLWKYFKGRVEQVALPSGSVLAIVAHNDRIFFSTSDGIWIYDNKVLQKSGLINETCTALISLDDDSLIVAGAQLRMMKGKELISFNFPRELTNDRILCFERSADKIFIGTSGGGIVIWDRPGNKVSRLTKDNGLESDYIYSLRFDHFGKLWAGTAKGIARLTSKDQFKSINVRNYGKEQGFNGMESNQNSIAVMDDNSIWFGTVRGAYCYHPGEDIENTTAPKLVIQSVKLFSKPILPGMSSDSASYSPFYPVPKNLRLSSANNHIGFDFTAITYNTVNLRYSYYLKGLEKNYATPEHLNSVSYPSLPPGNYTFAVKVFNESGKQLGEPLEYSFSILPAFYQELWFKFMVGIVLLLLIWAFFYVKEKRQKRQRSLIEALRMEEQHKMRKKTAEDFHDEMGNKLARITVLSDILQSKLRSDEEVSGLAKKIQDNAALLYQGAKDIIWSLNPKNDSLHTLLNHINNFAVDLFLDTDIEFQNVVINDEFSKYLLPMDYSRNILMICKEALTNILKHSQATKAWIDVAAREGNALRIVIGDNGRSFIADQNKTGNGLNNMMQRAQSINSNLEIINVEGAGVEVVLTVLLSRNGENNFDKKLM